MTTTEQVQVTLTFEERLSVAIGRGWPTQLKAAEALGVDRGTVTRWLKGTTKPPVAAVTAISEASGIAFEWLRPTLDELRIGLEWYAPRDLNPEPTD
ncbi:helix-turn-helix domain-containing protein [Demequina capsici]|uniref:helix-turn-helix domain-containing protein n=1 Tax=Demequina capsici TaxID=3075620 RepID=UPI0034D97CF1